jgi:hypothetical protein
MLSLIPSPEEKVNAEVAVRILPCSPFMKISDVERFSLKKPSHWRGSVIIRITRIRRNACPETGSPRFPG